MMENKPDAGGLELDPQNGLGHPQEAAPETLLTLAPPITPPRLLLGSWSFLSNDL